MTCTTPPPRSTGLDQFVEVMQQLSADLALQRGPAPACRRQFGQLQAWLAGRRQALLDATDGLRDDPEASALVAEWLRHSSLRLADPADRETSPAALAARAAMLEEQLLGVFCQLLQHSDSPWVARLYRDLLDHRLAGTGSPTAGWGTSPC
ncbi:MAG TPA: hypothetical protein VLI06_15750 [Solimonas sp.]|nr:hypothetical protein [Solimonas sp.]